MMAGRSSTKPVQTISDHLVDDVSMEKLLSVSEVADYLGIPVNTLYQWRHKNTGPKAFRVGRFLRYDPAAVRGWLTDQSEPTGVAHGTR